MFKARVSDPITIILAGGLLYTCLTFPLVQASSIANEVNASAFQQAFGYSVFCFVLLCVGLRLGIKVGNRNTLNRATDNQPRAYDLRPMIGRSVFFWGIGLLCSIIIVMTILGGFAALSTAIVTSNDLVRGKAWLFTTILPLKVGVFGVFLCLLTTHLRDNRILLFLAFVPMALVALFFLNVIGGRLLACGLVVQLLIVCGQVLQRQRRLLLLTEFFAVICLVTIVGVYGLGRYAIGVSQIRNIDSTEAAQEILRDQNNLQRMLLGNFFDPWFTLTEAVAYHERGQRPMYGLFHVTAFSKLVPGLYRYVDRHLSVSQIQTDARLGKRTVPYAVNAYLDFRWVGAGLFLLIGFAQSYSISVLRMIEQTSVGMRRFFANYLIGCVCVFSLYLFRSGLTICISWGFAELLVLACFALICIIRIRPHVAV